MDGVLIAGAVVMGLVVAVALRLFSGGTTVQWLLVSLFVLGNVVLVTSHSAALGLVGLLLLVGSLGALVALRVRVRP